MQVCNEDKQELVLGDDSTFAAIMTRDGQGRDFSEQRATWKEGTDFPFVAEFFATRELEEETTVVSKKNEDTSGVCDSYLGGADGNIIDIETV